MEYGGKIMRKLWDNAEKEREMLLKDDAEMMGKRWGNSPGFSLNNLQMRSPQEYFFGNLISNS
jgi:hypothetical protein